MVSLRGSLKVGRLAGAAIHLHYSVFLLANAFWRDITEPVWAGYALMLGVVLSILIHELGHALMARRFGLRDGIIVVHGFGGFFLADSVASPRQSLWITLAGPFVTLTLGGALLLSAGPSPVLEGWPGVCLILGRFNLILGVANMLPMLPFDGGLALQEFLAWKYPKFSARRVVARVGLFVGPVALWFGLRSFNLTVIIFAVAGLYMSFMVLFGGKGPLAQYRERRERNQFRQADAERSATLTEDALARVRERDEQERLRKLFGDD